MGKEYYKVFREEGKSLQSVHCNPPVIYSRRGWTSAPQDALNHGYGLLVFEDLDDACWFWSSRDAVIYSVKIEGIFPFLPPIRDFNRQYPWRTYRLTSSWPEGTVMVRSVKLLKEVKK